MALKEREFSSGKEQRLSFGIGSQNLPRATKDKGQLKQERSREAAPGTREALKSRGWQSSRERLDSKVKIHAGGQTPDSLKDL